jgi:alpha-galactosidase
MRKITFIGAGSFGFARKLVRDILTFPALEDATITLMDIDADRLEAIEKAVNKIIDAGGYPARLEATHDREAALDGADGVVITILHGGVEVWRHDIEIPKKYGVDINIGDTRGPSGVFRTLRTLPVMLDIASDIERLSPAALVLNYTNPMAMLCRGVQGESDVRMTGLCHSVQGTAEMLARWIGAPNEEITYLCAGINHQAWYLKYEWNGEDAYPKIREAIKRPEVLNEELVRNEMFRHLDYYVTESSGHNSEYVSWFRKRPDLIEKYCNHGTSWNPGVYAFGRDTYLGRTGSWKQSIQEWLDSDEIDLERGNEYAASIFNACIGDNEMFEFNGNIRNTGLITNLPEGCCVEVPVIASRAGLKAVHVGALPDHLALINDVSARCEELAVAGAIEGDRRKIFHAICMDPLTSAVCSLEEIQNMVDEMFARNREWLPQFKDI